jgi:ubiquitin carboxyl-terminal hydrolase 14
LTQTLIRNVDTPSNQLEKLLGIEVEEELTCTESADEPPVTRCEKLSKIVCSIQGGLGSTVTVDHMHEGIKIWLEGTVEKHSSLLNRDALWKRKARISKLPKYLCIQYLRFFWKPTPESSDHAGVKCKILRPVSFPETLDVYQFCSDAVQNELRINRESEDKAIEEAVKASSSASATAAAATPAEDNAMEIDDEEAKALQEAMAISLGRDPTNSSLFEHLPRNFTGNYELHSLVTHKGRSTDSGHYIGWTRQSPGSDAWWKYDDDKVTEATTADIMQLKGGGDRDMIYLVFYRAKSNADEK